jgi:hypothetical protein
MSITSLNFVISQFETEKYRYFIIFDEDNDTVYVQNDLIDQETALAKLRSFLRDNNGYFSIKVFSKKLTNPKNKIEQDKNMLTKFNVELTHRLNDNPMPLPSQNNGFNGFGSLPNDDPRSNAPNIYDIFGKMGQLTTEMKLMEKDHQHYRDMKDLQERLDKAEAEKSKSEGMSGVLSTLTENFKDPAVLMGLLSGVSGLFKGQSANVMPMNGVTDEVASNVSERKAKMVTAVNTLMKLDSEFPENVAMLAKLCENKPEMYKMAVVYLKSM